MPSHRKESEESSSASDTSGTGAGGGFFYRWRLRRAQKKVWAEIVDALEAHLESGAPIEDFLVYHLSERVEWDVYLQSWIVRLPSAVYGDLVLEPGNRVFLEDSRGGSQEDARIKEVVGDFVDINSGKSGIIYSLQFEPLKSEGGAS